MTVLLSRIYDQIILGTPRATLLVLFAIAVFFSYHAQNFQLDASADSLLLEDDTDLELFRSIRGRYPSQEVLIVTFSPKTELFSEQSLSQLGQLRDALRQIEQVDSVVSILDVPLLKSSNVPLAEIAENIQTLEKSGIDLQKAKQELQNSPLYSNSLISKHADTTGLLINLKDDSEFISIRDTRNTLRAQHRQASLNTDDQRRLEEAELAYPAAHTRNNAQRHQLVEAVRASLAPYRQFGTLFLGGVPMITDDMVTFVRKDLVTFGAGVLLFLIIILTFIFGQLRWITLPLVSCAYAGLVMIGLLGLIGWNVTVISSNFLALMLIITISMNIHLIVRYKQLYADHPDSLQLELVSTTVRKMVKPCLYTTLTTIIGFSSLVVSEIKPVIDFGWMMSAGLAASFLTSFLLLPSALMVLGKIDNSVRGEREFRIPAILAGITQRHGRGVVIVSVLLAIASIAGITRLKVENSFINYFSSGTEIYQGLKLIDEKLGGTTPLEIILNLDEEVELSPEDIALMTPEELAEERKFAAELASNPAYWFSAYKIEQIKAVHDYLDGLEEVGKVQSLASVIRVAEDLNDGKPFDGLELSVLYKRIPDDIKNKIIKPYLSIEDNEARFLLRILDSRKDLRRAELLQRINNDLTTKLNIEAKDITVTGLLVLYNNMLQSLFQSQISTLGVVMLGIALMFLLLFRSALLSVIGIAPNLMGALVVLGIMGWLNIPLDMMTITIAAITIGIAVDNGIHYIYRFKEEYAHNGDYIKTLYICHSNIGKAVLFTTSTIIFGFSILIFSNFIPTIYFGVLTALAMFIGLVAALTLLPKLILIFRPFR